MGREIRFASAEETAEVVRADWAAFGGRPTDVQIEDAKTFLEPDRVLAAVEGGRVVGTTAALSMEMTVPGRATVPAAGVTYVGVLPTHHRQGILTQLMARLHDDARGREETLAVLLASESTIYRRFGYGVAVLSSAVEIERSRALLRRPVDLRGRVRMLDPEEMGKALPPVYDRYRLRQPGELSRSPTYWATRLRDRPERRGDAGPLFAVLWEDEDGSAQGYATYRITQTWDDGVPGGLLAIEELVAPDPEVRAGLWQYCFDVDLVATVRAGNVPVDEALRWMLLDGRRLRVTQVKDFLWVRLLDVEAALAARSYAVDDELVIQVLDLAAPADAGGRYRVAGVPAGCHRTDAPADIALDVADLASAYLGGVRLDTLARAGLVAELTPGAVVRADAMFATARAPASLTGF